MSIKDDIQTQIDQMERIAVALERIASALEWINYKTPTPPPPPPVTIQPSPWTTPVPTYPTYPTYPTITWSNVDATPHGSITVTVPTNLSQTVAE